MPVGKRAIPAFGTFLAGLTLLLGPIPGTLLHAAQSQAPTLLDVRSDNVPGTIRLVCDGTFDFERAEENDPSRVVVDLPGVRNGLTHKVDFKSDLVKGISVTSLPSSGGQDGTRVILDLVRPCSVSLLAGKDSLAVVLGKSAASDPPPKEPEPPTVKPTPQKGVVGTAAPVSPGSTAEDLKSEYIIGKEDLLEMGVFEQPDLTRTVRVSGDGTISLPLLGKVALEGLSTTQAEEKLRDLLADRYLTDPQVWVSVKEAKSKKVSVVGAVEKPGTIEMLRNRSLLEAISEAGGLTHQAGKELYVLRPDASGASTRIDIDLDDLMINGNPELNIPLEPGDVVNIPIDRILHVYVDGAVRKPGEVEYKASRPLNLIQAIAAAGGLSERASQKGIVVIRTKTGGAQEMMRVDLKAVRKGKQENFVLENGDSIYVPETFF